MDYQLGPGPLQVDQNIIDEKIKGDIGIVENGDVAAHPIPRGYYVIWKGDLYIAKTDISSGTTLSAASNGNLTAKPNGLGGEVALLSDQIATNSDTTTYTKLSDIKTALNTLAETLSANQTKFIRIHTGTDTSLSPFTAWNDFIGYMQKQSSGYWIATLIGRDGVDVTVTDSNGTINAYSLSNQVGNIRNVVVAEADVTTSANGNFSIAGLSSSSHILLSIIVTSPDDAIAIPYKYGTGAGLLGGHAMSCLSAQSVIANANLHIKYAYVAI